MVEPLVFIPWKKASCYVDENLPLLMLPIFFFANLKWWIFHLIFSFRLVSAFATFVDAILLNYFAFYLEKNPMKFPTERLRL